nr:MAG TPA: hypothetical protein [Caudoviricetes sp.]
MCSAVLDYRRLVYSCQQPNLYNLYVKTRFSVHFW